MYTDLTVAIDAFDLEAYVQERGADEIQAGQWMLTCPSCMKPKLIVDTRKKAWHCWVCEEKAQVMTPMGPREQTISGGGGLIDLIQLLDEVSRREAVDVVLFGNATAVDLAAIPEVDLVGSYLAAGLEITPVDPPDGMVPIRGQLDYCVKRGITEEDIQLFQLHWCLAGRYGNRLVFPVFEQGHLVYWQARAMWEPQPGEKFIKALNPPRTPGVAVSSDVLFNLELAAAYQRVVVTEGPIDAIHVGPWAVCSFGKRLHATQIAKLIRAGVRHVDLMWDGPSDTEPQGAYPEMVATAAQIAPLFDSVRVVRLPWGDPGNWRRDQLWAFQQQCGVMVQTRSLLEAL